jgi:hypothetical protein
MSKSADSVWRTAAMSKSQAKLAIAEGRLQPNRESWLDCLAGLSRPWSYAKPQADSPGISRAAMFTLKAFS